MDANILALQTQNVCENVATSIDNNAGPDRGFLGDRTVADWTLSQVIRQYSDDETLQGLTFDDVCSLL